MLESLVVSSKDGPTFTSAVIVGMCNNADDLFTLPRNFFYPGRALQVIMSGRISCAATTPGTVRLFMSRSLIGLVMGFDTGALALNTAGKTDVPWSFNSTMVCRSVGAGSATALFCNTSFSSEAVAGSAIPSSGSNGFLCAPVGAPVIGSGFDNTSELQLLVYFEQSVQTGSFTVMNYRVDLVN